jgi:hypothetical protein
MNNEQNSVLSQNNMSHHFHVPTPKRSEGSTNNVLLAALLDKTEENRYFNRSDTPVVYLPWKHPPAEINRSVIACMDHGTTRAE